jgi:hypothetical protein
VERERVARRLRHQQRELETHGYKLQQLKKLSERTAGDDLRLGKDLRTATKVERRKIRHRKERVGHLASRMEIKAGNHSRTGLASWLEDRAITDVNHA